MRIAVIGAGIAGAALARSLEDKADIEVFEKSRGLGGRMAQRRAAPFFFDHGAQYFTVREELFRSFLAPYLDAGVVCRWSPRMVIVAKGQSPQHYSASNGFFIASPKMNALVGYVLKDIPVHLDTRVTSITGGPGCWRLMCDNGAVHGSFDWVITCTPAPQASTLLPAEFTHGPQLHAVNMRACFSLMLGFANALEVSWECARVRDSSLAWIALNSSKPQREGGYSLIAQSRNDWAQEHVEDDHHVVRETLINELGNLLGCDLPNPQLITMHRWRYADTSAPLGQDYLIDPDAQLAACGDWCIESRVEAAFLSGHRLAIRLARHLSD